MNTNICQYMLLWWSDLAKHEQEQQVVEAIESAADYKRPAKARKSKKIARKDRTCCSCYAPRSRCDACGCGALGRGDNGHYIRCTRRHIHLGEGASYERQRYGDPERRRKGN
jgi:hypothetical protein